MGNRMREQYLNTIPGGGGRVRVTIRPDQMEQQLCPCGTGFFRSVYRAFAMPAPLVLGVHNNPLAKPGIALVEYMACCSCGHFMPNPNAPAAVLAHGMLVACSHCSGQAWELRHEVFRVSRLVAGTQNDVMHLRPSHFCAACGEPLGGQPKPDNGRGDAENLLE